ncbi:T9SS type A sorting domain-containing protein [Terrimonas sp. NA20]|uniref:T9SS type A sorting domain-containing protein n=1 Tax=Terrimonas ginsenosidimutans TaxID=2908004 RepID=A0ABS9KYH6_9BACT|nr:M43 family zinc metalloprotease [Terrimonas ginsenosidimutans]MCG2617375.1 T9SS type A sorting domain-containing protein [Terrimonas ginsenosidimutans]
MRNLFIGIMLLLVAMSPVIAQPTCYSFDYRQDALRANPVLSDVVQQVEQFIQTQGEAAFPTQTTSRGKPVITIPVVVHVLYNKQNENVSEQAIKNMIETLNLCFRRLHPDTIKTPARFWKLSADTEIEFQLASSDPQKRATNGIVRKYSARTQWDMDDKMKLSSQSGDDAWDPSSYLNIWICNVRFISGYSSVPGDAAVNDGIVLATGALGKAIVHEVGHWLGLKHIWGDQYCGDDGVADTPQQATGTPGCPSGIRPSCNNGPDGDMYMNYMDQTQDACVNMFTLGQKKRMLALFQPGGVRYSLFASKGLDEPLYTEIPLPVDPVEPVKEEQTQALVYPNPARQDITIDLGNDQQWIGKVINIANSQGLVVMQQSIKATVQKIDISKLPPGMYFILGKREDGAVIKKKFLRLGD